MSRKPITIVEIDMPYCVNVFGTAPCTAALSAAVPHKCFNTRKSCQSVPNFNAGVLTLRFAQNLTGIPKGQTIFPALQSVSDRPAELNLSGIDPATTALGKRARVTVTLQDFTYQDTLTDKYQAQRVSGAAQFSGVGYNPIRGGFFAKLIARQPYYVGRALRVKRGYVGDALGAMETAAYVISEWAGPDANGKVTIVAKDILDLAENTKAVAPAVSLGKLVAAISDVDTSLTLTPAGAGAAYAAAGRVCVGREVMTYTLSGDVLTLTARGVDGTKAASHSINDLAQQCLRYTASRLSDAISDLLLTYAGIPAGYVTTADWHLEEDSWLSGMTVTTTITKPTGVSKLVGEICQLGVMVWWDEIAQQIRFRCNRPMSGGETVYQITDNKNIIVGTPDISRGDDERISAIYLWHGMLDPTDTATDGKNFAKVAIAAVDENLYEQDAFKEIFTRWFGQFGDDGAAGVITERLLGRYRDTPKLITATLDMKDRPGISLGALISVTSYLIQDETGLVAPETMQVNKVLVSGDRITIGAETYSISGRFCFWMQNPLPDYSTATATQKQFGAFWMDDAIGTFPDGTGPYVYF